MNKLIRLICFVLLFSQCSGKISLQEQTFIDLKQKNPAIHVPTPFVYCTHRGQSYPEGANQIIGNIQDKMAEMCASHLKIDFMKFSNSDEYSQYGKALYDVIVQLGKKDMEEVRLPQYLKDLSKSSPHDMSVFVFNIANPRTRAQNAAQNIGAAGLGVTLGLITGFAPVMPFAISSKLHFIIYSKSQDAIISYEDSEDKDDPTIKENCDEEVDMLFSRFVDAGQAN
ncbi:MAG TPA: hypothetical protein VHO70_18265 [Chitinispirillaceae bacterium]|nr:hypothetical protein [Chitinispirillaceae bacterium]